MNVLNFAEDPSLVISDCIVLYGIVSHFFPEPVDHLDPMELQDDSTASPTRDVNHLVSLQSDLHLMVLSNPVLTLVMKGIMK